MSSYPGFQIGRPCMTCLQHHWLPWTGFEVSLRFECLRRVPKDLQPHIITKKGSLQKGPGDTQLELDPVNDLKKFPFVACLVIRSLNTALAVGWKVDIQSSMS